MEIESLETLYEEYLKELRIKKERTKENGKPETKRTIEKGRRKEKTN